MTKKKAAAKPFVSGRNTRSTMTADQYERHKDAARVRNREKVAKTQDIAAAFPDCRMPEPEDRGRRERCRNDFPLFVKTYGDPDWKEFSPDHYNSMKFLNRIGLEGGKLCNLMPRNYAKTTIGELWDLWGMAYGHFPLVQLIFASEVFARDSVAALRLFVEYDDGLFARDFPEIHIPAVALDGQRQRCAGQKWDGRHTDIDWSDEQIVMPVVPKPGMRWSDGPFGEVVADSSGWCLRSLGARTTKIHGAKFRSPRDGTVYRPAAIHMDDWNDDSNACSPGQNEKFVRIIKNGAARSRSLHKRFSMLYNGTCFAPDDIGDQLADPRRSPDWQGIRISALKEWPRRRDLWDRFGELLRDFDVNAPDGDVRSQPAARGRADALLAENWAAMHEGADVAWEHAYSVDEGEKSALHALMLVYYTAGPEVFACACQNRPLEPSETEGAERRIRPAELATRLNAYKRGELPSECGKLTAFVDVQDRILYWMVTAWSMSFTGYVVDYGTFPRQPRPYFAVRELGAGKGVSLERAYAKAHPESPLAGKEALWRWGLGEVAELLCGRAWRRDDGVDMRVDRLLVDANDGEAQSVVFEFCRQAAHTQCMPCTGAGVKAGAKPFPLYESRAGEHLGDYWILRSSQKQKLRYVRADVNYWKTFIRTRLRTPVGDPGALTVFGGGGVEGHALLFDHLSSEYSVRTSGPHGSCQEWSATPGAENHWWDCLVGGAVAASMEGVSRPGAAAVARVGARRWKTLKEARAMRGRSA